MHGCVIHDFIDDLWPTISKLFAFIWWITSKEIYIVRIPQWPHEKIVDIVCMFEKELTLSFMELHIHLLIHLVDEVELVGVVSCHGMFSLERHMKKFKGFVRQREKHEGCMEDGYIVYDSFYYVHEYIKKIEHLLGAAIWDDESLVQN